jgi:hypothetical protein
MAVSFIVGGNTEKTTDLPQVIDKLYTNKPNALGNFKPNPMTF